MAITAISRDQGVNPSVVRMTTDNTLSEMTAANYLLAEAANIHALNHGDFDWQDRDLVAVACIDGNYMCIYDKTNQALVLFAGNVAARFAGQHTTAGGAAAEVIALPGALATDLAFVQLVDEGGNNRTVLKAVMGADTLTVTFSGDPGNDAVVNYQVLRGAL